MKAYTNSTSKSTDKLLNLITGLTKLEDCVVTTDAARDGGYRVSYGEYSIYVTFAQDKVFVHEDTRLSSYASIKGVWIEEHLFLPEMLKEFRGNIEGANSRRIAKERDAATEEYFAEVTSNLSPFDLAKLKKLGYV